MSATITFSTASHETLDANAVILDFTSALRCAGLDFDLVQEFNAEVEGDILTLEINNPGTIVAALPMLTRALSMAAMMGVSL